jgi:hypothetical protein
VLTRAEKNKCDQFKVDRCGERDLTCGYPNTLVLYHRTYQRYVSGDKKRRFLNKKKFNEVYRIFRRRHKITRLLEKEMIHEKTKLRRFKLNENHRHRFYNNLCQKYNQKEEDNYNRRIFLLSLMEYKRLYEIPQREGQGQGSRSRGGEREGSRSRGEEREGSRSRGGEREGSRSRGEEREGSRSRGGERISSRQEHESQSEDDLVNFVRNLRKQKNTNEQEYQSDGEEDLVANRRSKLRQESRKQPGSKSKSPASSKSAAPRSKSKSPASLKSPNPRSKSKSPAPRSKSKSPAPRSKSKSPAPKSKSKSPAPKSKSKSPAPKSKSKSPASRKKPTTKNAKQKATIIERYQDDTYSAILKEYQQILGDNLCSGDEIKTEISKEFAVENLLMGLFAKYDGLLVIQDYLQDILIKITRPYYQNDKEIKVRYYVSYCKKNESLFVTNLIFICLGDNLFKEKNCIFYNIYLHNYGVKKEEETNTINNLVKVFDDLQIKLENQKIFPFVGTFNTGNNNIQVMRILIEALGKKAGIKATVEKVPEDPLNNLVIYVSNTKSGITVKKDNNRGNFMEVTEHLKKNKKLEEKRKKEEEKEKEKRVDLEREEAKRKEEGKKQRRSIVPTEKAEGGNINIQGERVTRNQNKKKQDMRKKNRESEGDLAEKNLKVALKKKTTTETSRKSNENILRRSSRNKK